MNDRRAHKRFEISQVRENCSAHLIRNGRIEVLSRFEKLGSDVGFFGRQRYAVLGKSAGTFKIEQIRERVKVARLHEKRDLAAWTDEPSIGQWNPHPVSSIYLTDKGGLVRYSHIGYFLYEPQKDNTFLSRLRKEISGLLEEFYSASSTLWVRFFLAWKRKLIVPSVRLDTSSLVTSTIQLRRGRPASGS